MNTKTLQIESRLTLNTWAYRHPIAAYTLFTLAWSWSIWSLLFLFIKPGDGCIIHRPFPSCSLLWADLVLHSVVC